ncbi:DUF5808 domain-containing protein [Flavobacterium caeni]|uniref:DUF5808 domain-containing protein n=1 Tax=Flavobacterium caeni TaxID=490189 RepID=A0A1G5FM26_9FLAO|nr:DUF5808 domain-containing protein [Flavobacterium caeni]SCY40402.1 hypothetical protein SAMN02927903_01340 [Flavobacterium caeni]
METPQEKQWRENPDNWIWGMFYFNREDKRMLPPKRTPWMGWTVNFANRKSVLFFVGMMAFFAMVVYLIGRGR